MDLAAGKSLTSTGGLWAITLVAVAGLAFWLIMTVGVAPRRPGRGLRRHGQPPAANQVLANEAYTPRSPGIPGTPGADQRPVAPRTLSGAATTPDSEAAPDNGAAPAAEPTMTGAGAPADPKMATGPGVGAHPDAAVTRDDLPRVPAQRADDEPAQEPATGWSAPAQRQSETDEAVASRRDQSRQDRDRPQG